MTPARKPSSLEGVEEKLAELINRRDTKGRKIIPTTQEVAQAMSDLSKWDFFLQNRHPPITSAA